MARVAFIYPNFDRQGGAETHVLAAIQALINKNHHVILFTSTYNEQLYTPKIQAPYFVYVLGGRGDEEGLGGTWRMIRRLSHVLVGYDLVIAVNFPAHVWVALGTHGVPVVWMCMEPKRNLYPDVMYAEARDFQPHGYRRVTDYLNHPRQIWQLLTQDPHVLLPYGIRAALQRVLDRAAVQRVTLIIANSPYIADKVHHIYGASQRVVVGWAGIPDRSVMKPTTATKTIIIPTRLEPIKNVEVVIRALQHLKGDGRLQDYRAIIMGTGSDETRLQEMINQLALADVITMTGYVSDAERDTLYAQASMVVYPSLAEPLGLPVAEAGLQGKAVIADQRGGPATMIQHGKTGLLTDMTDSDALASSIADLIASPTHAEALGRAARAHLRQWMAFDAWTENFSALVEAELSRLSLWKGPSHTERDIL